MLYEPSINSANALEEYHICCNFHRCGCKPPVRYFIHSALAWEDFSPTAVLTSSTTIVKGNKDVALKAKMISNHKTYSDLHIQKTRIGKKTRPGSLFLPCIWSKVFQNLIQFSYLILGDLEPYSFRDQEPWRP